MPANHRPDAVFRTSLREFWQIMVYWGVFFGWVIGYCSFHSYPDPGQPVPTVLGMPAWVVWGVFVPWLVSTAFTIWFALWRMADQSLEPAGDKEHSDD